MYLFIHIFKATMFLLPVPLLPLLVGVAIYSVLVPSLLYRFPGSFSIGEVIIVGQGLTLLILDVLLQLASQVRAFLSCCHGTILEVMVYISIYVNVQFN